VAADSQKFTGGEVSKAKKSDDLQKEPGPITLRLQRDGVSDLGCNFAAPTQGLSRHDECSVRHYSRDGVNKLILARARQGGSVSSISRQELITAPLEP